MAEDANTAMHDLLKQVMDGRAQAEFRAERLANLLRRCRSVLRTCHGDRPEDLIKEERKQVLDKLIADISEAV